MNFSQLMSLASGHVEARIVQTAVELGVFDALAVEANSADALARQLHLEAQATELLLNALTALDLLEKQEHVFSLTDVSKLYLLRNSRHFVGGMIQFDASLWSCWEKLPDALRTGKAVRPPNMYQDDPVETATFINAMDSLVKARGDADMLATAMDWNGVNTLLDVGSGPASYPIALCQRFANLKVTIFDLPATLKITERFVHDAVMTDRIRFVAGDYRSNPISGRYDAVFLSNIVHGENSPRNKTLIEKLAAILNPGGRLIIKDHSLEDSRTDPPVGAVFSLLMLLTTEGGRCYSFREIAAWMKHAGLNRVQRIDFAPPLTSSLVIGTK